MKREGILKQLALLFIVVVGLYALIFAGLQHWRVRKGPWAVTFSGQADGERWIEVNQARLGIDRVRLRFPNTSEKGPLPETTIRFDTPDHAPLPFGQLKFIDGTFLPGTVTFDLFGHEVEMLPRVLILDKQEHPWHSGETIDFASQAVVPKPLTQ